MRKGRERLTVWRLSEICTAVIVLKQHIRMFGESVSQSVASHWQLYLCRGLLSEAEEGLISTVQSCGRSAPTEREDQPKVCSKSTVLWLRISAKERSAQRLRAWERWKFE